MSLIISPDSTSFSDTSFELTDDVDPSKKATFQLSGITTNTTRVYTLPNVSNTLAHLGAGAQVFQSVSLTLGNSTAASSYGLGVGATLAATTKDISIGTGGVSTSTTNIDIGAATTFNATNLYGTVRVRAALDVAGAAVGGNLSIYGSDWSTAPASFNQATLFAVPWTTINAGTNTSSLLSIQTSNSANTWTFSSTGQLNLPLDTAIIRTSASASSILQIKTAQDAYTWSFGNTGILSAPGNITTTAQLASTVATGTAPLSVASTTLVTNLNADLLDGISSGSFLRSDANNDTATGNIYTSGWLEAGRTSGSVALTTNDTYGNANIAFNHKSGTPDVTGNSGRITVNVDGTSGVYMAFQLKSTTTTGVAVALTQVLALDELTASFATKTVSSSTVQGTQLISTITTGTAPLSIASTTVVANLNASLLSGNAIGTSGATIPLLNGTNTFSGINKFSSGINAGNEALPTYKFMIDFGSDVAGTWRRFVIASLAAINYSTVGFKIRVVDPNANHATTTSVNADFETYMVACIRQEALVTDTPDNCVVRGPGNRIRAVKTSTGNYEIQIQNEFASTEYFIEVECYAINGTHTITYEPGITVGSTGTAQYNAAVGSSVAYFEKISAANQIVSTVTTGTAPLSIASTTVVANLNASLLSGNAIGTSGATIPLLNGSNTFSGTNTFSTTAKVLGQLVLANNITAAGTFNTASTVLQSHGTTAASNGFVLGNWGASVATSPAIEFIKGRGGVLGDATGITNTLTNGDTIAQIIASGFDATTVNNVLQQSSAIKMSVGATPTVGFTPGKIAFWTSGTASANASRVEIGPTGLLSALNGLTVTGTTTLGTSTISLAGNFTTSGAFATTITTTGTTSVTLPTSGTLAQLGDAAQTFTGATTFSPTTAGSSLIFGNTNSTGFITLGRSTVSQQINIAQGATVAAATKDINIGTNGVSTSNTNITIGSATSNTVTNIYGEVGVLAAQTAGVASNGIIKIHGKDFGTVPATITQGNLGAPWLLISSGSSTTSFASITTNNATNTWTFSSTGQFSLPLDTAIIRTSASASSILQIKTAQDAYTWSFGNTGTLSLPALLQLTAVSDPAAPAAGSGYLYAKDIAGRIVPKWIGPSGIDYPLQAHIGFNNVRAWRGGATIVATTFAGTTGTLPYTGASPTAPTIPNLATTNLLTQTARSTISTGATAGGLAYIRGNQLSFWRGNAAGLGGFMVIHRFAISGTLQAGMRACIGVVDVAANPTNIDPLTTTTPGGIGLAVNTNTGNWSLVNNITGTARTATGLGASFPLNNTSLMELVLWSVPNGASIGYRVTNLSTGATTSGSLSTNIPASTTFLTPVAWVTNNATAAAQTLDFISTYVETDY